MNAFNAFEIIVASIGSLTAVGISVLEYKAGRDYDKEILKLQLKSVYEPLYSFLKEETVTENTPSKIQNKISEIKKILALSNEDMQLIPIILREDFKKVELKPTEKQYKKFVKTVSLQYKKARNILKIYPREKYTEQYVRNIIVTLFLSCLFVIIFNSLEVQLYNKYKANPDITVFVEFLHFVFNFYKIISVIGSFVVGLIYSAYIIIRGIGSFFKS